MKMTKKRKTAKFHIKQHPQRKSSSKLYFMTPGASFTFQWSTYISWTLMTSTSRQWWVVMISHFDVTVTYMYTLILSESIEIICSSDTLTWVRTKFRSIGLQAIQNYNMHMGAISVHHSTGNKARTSIF